jgi:hypothetical protein
MIGGRSLATFKLFVLPELVGVIVHDRHVNYDSQEYLIRTVPRPVGLIRTDPRNWL